MSFKTRFPIVTLLVLASAFALYYFFYVNNKREYLIERNFRLLGAMGDRLEEELLTARKVVGNAVPQAGKEGAPDKQFANALTLAELPLKPLSPSELKIFEKMEHVEGDLPILQERLTGGNQWFHFLIDGYGARVKVEELIAPILEPESFDKLLFASGDGRVLYQEGKGDLKLVSLSGLKTQNGEPVDVVDFGRSSRLLDVEVAGQKYKLFVQPCWIPRNESEVGFSSLAKLEEGKERQEGKAEKEKKQKEEEKSRTPPPDPQVWLLCGLMSAHHLRMEAASISATLATVLVALSVLTALFLPFLKLVHIRPEERLRAMDGLLAALCGFLGISFLTIFLLDILASRNLGEQSRSQVKDLSDRLARNLTAELDEAYGQLRAFHEVAMQELKKQPNAQEELSRGDLLKGMEDLTKRLPGESPSYKDFYTFVWVDATGMQTLRWSILPQAHPPIRVTTRQYFTDVLRDRVWTRCTKPAKGQRLYARFSMEPVRIATTGQSLAVLSMPTVRNWRPDSAPCDGSEYPVFRPEEGSDIPEAAVLSSYMVSVNHPVLPPGFGFAVVDPKGRVLFHSNQKRALHENLLQEVDSNRALQAHLVPRRPGWISARYNGREHLLYITPLENLPLSVVAFRDKTVLRTINVEILLTALIGLIAYSLLFITLFSLLYLIPAFRARWIWPDSQFVAAYRQLAVVYAAFLILAMPLLLWYLAPAHAFWMGMLIPLYFLVLTYLRIHVEQEKAFSFDAKLATVLLFGLIVLILLLAHARDLPFFQFVLFAVGLVLCLAFLFTPGTRRWFEPKQRIFPRPSYLLAGSLLLAILSVFPAVMFFNVAFRIQTENFVKHGQAMLAEELKEREERVRALYRKVNGADESFLQARLDRGRIDKDPRDVYASIFFETRLDQCAESDCRQSEREPERHDWLPRFFQDLLPLYNDTSAEISRRTEDREEGRWWQHGVGVKLVLHGTGYGRGEPLHLVSDLPRQFEKILPNSWWLIPCLLLLGAAIWGTVNFITKRLMLLRVDAPFWLRDLDATGAIPGGDVFFVLRPEDNLDLKIQHETIDLKEVKDLRAEAGTEKIKNATVVFVKHFEHRLRDWYFSQEKLNLLENLVQSGKRVLVSSSVDPYIELVSGSSFANGPGGERVEARWRTLLDSFNIKHWSLPFEKELEDRRQNLRLRNRRKLDLIKEECKVNVFLQKIGLQLASTEELTKRDHLQILEEILDFAEGHYRSLWQSLSEKEKLALVQLAEEGLPNPNNRRSVQRLMARGLVVRNPALQAMNQTFRRFVTSGACYVEATRIEGAYRESSWLRLQRPLVTLLIGVGAFFFITQRETFDLTLVFISAIAASLPQLLKVVNYLGARMAEGEQA